MVTILQKLTRVASDAIRLQRYIKQLGVLSRLRNLQQTTYQQVKHMPVEYDIETDYLFQQGEKRGREEGKEATQQVIFLNMLRSGQLTDQQVAAFAGVSLTYVAKIRKTM